LNRSSIYYKPVEESAEDLDLMLKMDKEYHQHPTKGVLGMVDFIKKFGILIGPKKVRRLLRKMGVMAIYPGKISASWGWQNTFIHTNSEG
jgi:putative transposase